MKIGLDATIVADTVLSHSDPLMSRLWIRGVPLEEAACDLGYEGTAALLWEGFAGRGLTRGSVTAEFGAGRQWAFDRLEWWLPLVTGRTPGEATRRCIAALPDNSGPAEVMGALAVGVPAVIRHHRGLPPVPPDPTLPAAADFFENDNRRAANVRPRVRS
jgi:citrate synthase